MPDLGVHPSLVTDELMRVMRMKYEGIVTRPYAAHRGTLATLCSVEVRKDTDNLSTDLSSMSFLIPPLDSAPTYATTPTNGVNQPVSLTLTHTPPPSPVSIESYTLQLTHLTPPPQSYPLIPTSTPRSSSCTSASRPATTVAASSTEHDP
jgi:hypothetical protein